MKAGKMRTTPIENRFRVEADERRGLLLLEKGSDGATHFIWKDRQTLQVVDDLLVFPGDQSLQKVDTGRPGDRVYLLTFKTSASRRLFFWMQEPDASKDEERVKEVNRLMNDVNSLSNPVRGLGGAGLNTGPLTATAPAVGLDELSDILSGLGYSGGTSDESAQPTETTETMDVEGQSAPKEESQSEGDKPADQKPEEGEQ
jgi:hypothetical protein